MSIAVSPTGGYAALARDQVLTACRHYALSYSVLAYSVLAYSILVRQKELHDETHPHHP
jgi:hypothetical protein